jgi:hypothetical protein
MVVKLPPLTGGQQVHQDNAADVPSQNDLKNSLEKGSDEQKIETMVCPPAVRMPRLAGSR